MHIFPPDRPSHSLTCATHLTCLFNLICLFNPSHRSQSWLNSVQFHGSVQSLHTALHTVIYILCLQSPVCNSHPVCGLLLLELSCYYTVVLLVQPTWDQTELCAGHDLKWVRHLWTNESPTKVQPLRYKGIHASSRIIRFIWTQQSEIFLLNCQVKIPY